MQAEAAIYVGTQIATVAALGGMMWQWKNSHEKHEEHRHRQILQRFESVEESIQSQTVRIDDLEAWRSRRQGFLDARRSEDVTDGPSPTSRG